MSNRPLIAMVFLAVWAAGSAGCGIRGSMKLQSVDTGGELTPRIRVLAYRADDRESADVYLTDLAPADLDPGADLDELTGNIVHIHLFLMPRAGRTPIGSTASSVTIRFIVLSRGAIGVYGGGGFLLPRGRPGGKTFGGSIRDATMKLIASNTRFRDPLGACTLSASFRAPLDESQAGLLAQRLDEILARVKE